MSPNPHPPGPAAVAAELEILIGAGRNALQDVEDQEHLTSEGWRSIATADRAFQLIHDQMRCRLLGHRYMLEAAA